MYFLTIIITKNNQTFQQYKMLWKFNSNSKIEPSLYTVKAVFILDNDGNRLLSKYYDPELYPTMKEQKNFENNVFSKTHKADNEIAFLEGMTIIYKSSIDLFFYVVGSAQENELMLMSVLNCLFDSVSHILRKNVERRCLLDNMEGVFLVLLLHFLSLTCECFLFQADDNPLTEQSVAQVTHTDHQAALLQLHLRLDNMKENIISDIV
uniref:Coatomer subunit zeta n=1 Tax=Xiphophorus couchianus TaxID=32473 RepID=A0A3B5LZB1_9TELE